MFVTPNAPLNFKAVKPDSEAYRAGLRDGQTLVKRGHIYVGDATKTIEMTVHDGSEGQRAAIPFGK